MTMTRKTITIPNAMEDWVKSQVAAGRYASDSEYFRDLVRRDQEQNARTRALKAAIQEGLDSDDSESTVGEIWGEAEGRHQAKRG